MQVLHAIADLQGLNGSAIHLAIGVFDGVHIGHRAVIQEALAAARAAHGLAVVVTFDPHPAMVLRPASCPALLSSTRHKLRLLGDLGVTHTLVVPFDLKFAATPPADFLRQLAHAGQPLRQISVGENWAFGKGRAGNLALLRELGQELGFRTAGLSAVAVDGVSVSSTAIRSAVQTGELATAAAMLGRDFSIFGAVVQGRQLARTLGFPTANLRPEREQLPPDGVYVVRVAVDDRSFWGVANVGLRPTVENPPAERLVEAHLFDFEGELVGRDIEVSFLKGLRAERKFSSLEALKEQIALDAAAARAFVGG